MGRTIEIAAATILDGSRMLVVRKQGSAVFMQPGGKIEADETPEAALRRERAEEIAIVLGPEAPAPLGLLSAPAAGAAACSGAGVVKRISASPSPALPALAKLARLMQHPSSAKGPANGQRAGHR